MATDAELAPDRLLAGRSAAESDGGRRSRVLSRTATVVSGVLGLVLVLSVHGYLPGLSQPALRTFLAVGDIQCLRLLGLEAFRSYCDTVGAPVGRPLLTGLPQLYLAWGVSYLPGADPWRAHQVVNVLTTLVAFVGLYGLARRWQVPPGLAVVAPVVYLSSLSVLGLNGFAFTFAGFCLLPTYLLLFLLMLDAVERRQAAPALLILLLLPTYALFVDGYSFVALVVASGVLGTAWCLRRPGLVAGALAVGGWAVGLASAYLLYAAYVPPGAEDLQVGIGAFRFLGLDVATLVVPQGNLWWASLSGAGVDLSSLWGDGSNTSANYIGLVFVALVVWLMLRGTARLPRRAAAETRAMAVLAVAALFLSFGPALKVFDVEVPVTPGWDVPEELVTLQLPTEWVYENVPGFDKMRATFRWFLVTRLAVVLLGLVAVGVLWRAGRRGLAVVLLTAAVLETTVHMPSTWAARERDAAHVVAVRSEVLPEAQQLLRSGEAVLALPPSNDFLAGVVAGSSDITTYNVGGDRNYRLAREAWPTSVQAAVSALGTAEQNDAICAALVDEVDAVLLPAFSLYRNALTWPPAAEVVMDAEARAATIVPDARFQVRRGTWFDVVRLRPGTAAGSCAMAGG